MSISSAAGGDNAGEMKMAATAARIQRVPGSSLPKSKIYAWESSAGEKHTPAPVATSQRVAIEVDGVRFEPAAAEGFYNRRGRAGARDEMSIQHENDEDDEAEDEQTRTGCKSLSILFTPPISRHK